MILFMDTETTGLSPFEHELLEVGLALTDDNLTWITGIDLVILPDWWPNQAGQMFDASRFFQKEAFEMHKKSGLLDDIPRLGISRLDAEGFLIDFVEHNQAGDLPTAGSSIHFDRAFTSLHMPKLDGLFHYRQINVSTLKELARLWNKPVMKERNFKAPHRVLGDIQDTIDELAHYREHLIQNG